MKIRKYIGIGLVATAFLSSCSSDFLDTEYTSNLDQEAAINAGNNDPTAFLNGMWSWMVKFNTYGGESHDDFSFMSVLHSTDMMSEDIAMAAFHWFGYDYGFDNRMYNYRRTHVDWNTFYSLIAKANEIIALYPEGGNTDKEKGLIGQAYAVRGMAYYYLVQLYQNCVKADGTINSDAPAVPMKLLAVEGATEEQIDAAMGRNTVKDLFNQIESDYSKAIENLQNYAPESKNEISLQVALGLQARYYLLSQQWSKAEASARSAQVGYTIMDEKGLQDGFMDISNSEWMWGFDHNTETQTTYASFFSMISSIAPGYAGLGYNTNLIDARLYGMMNDTDFRKQYWFNGPDGNNKYDSYGATLPYANTKFGSDGNWTMDYVYMRAAEMVLIEAEALARQGKNTEAATALKKLMAKRDPSWNMPSVSAEDVVLQRRIELWGEGFAYFDLKRLNKGINRKYDGNNHLAGYDIIVPAQDPKWTYQIPLKELQENTHITDADQNP